MLERIITSGFFSRASSKALLVAISILLSPLAASSSTPTSVTSDQTITPALPDIAKPSLHLRHGSLGLQQLSIVEDGKVIGGFKYEFLEALAERLGWTMEHSYCPFQRCLRSMADGSLDIMVFIAVTQQRSQYLDFVQVWPIPRKIPFYMLKGQTHRLQSYEDLHNLRIGVVNGYAYFTRFDHDSQIRKSAVLKESQLPKMLIAGRIDAYIGFSVSRDLLMQQYPQLAVAPFAQGFTDTALLAISQKSPLANRADELEAAALSLIKDGTLDQLWQKFFDDDVLQYPRHLGPDSSNSATTQ